MKADPTIVLAIIALISSFIAAAFAFRGKKGETKTVDDANLRDDQRELIVELRLDSITNREARISLEKEVDRLRKDMRDVIEMFEKKLTALRDELEQTRVELEQERVARRAGEAGWLAEHQARTAGIAELGARQAGEQARQDIHDEPGPHPHSVPPAAAL